MANSEESNIGQSNTEKFDKTAYQREYMRKKREVDKLKDEQREDREGGVDASESPIEPVTVSMSVPVPMTKADAKFEVQRPNYWIYGKEVIERECWKCGDGFKTRLEMNKFCGPKCKEEWLSDAFGKLKASKPEHVAN